MNILKTLPLLFVLIGCGDRIKEEEYKGSRHDGCAVIEWKPDSLVMQCASGISKVYSANVDRREHVCKADIYNLGAVIECPLPRRTYEVVVFDGPDSTGGMVEAVTATDFSGSYNIFISNMGTVVQWFPGYLFSTIDKDHYESRK